MMGELVETRPGAVLGGRYRLGDWLADSDVGAVYQARRIADDRRVAIKLLSTPGAVSSELTARLRLDCELLKKVAHPNVIDVLDVGTGSDGAPFMVMEYLAGETLADRLASRGRLAAIESLRIATRVASALSAAHRQGIAHTALRPREIFLARAEQDAEVVKVLGFGLGRLSGASRIALRVDASAAAYSAPEQLDAKSRVDHRADQFALAAITYEMLTGTSPFSADSVAGVVQRIRGETPAPPSRLEPGVVDVADAILLRAMHKDPLERYPNMSQLGQALENAAAAASVGPKSRRQTPSTAPAAIYRLKPEDTGHARTEPAPAHLAELRAKFDASPAPAPPNEIESARRLAAAVRDALTRGDLDAAVARGEELFEHALVHQKDAEVLAVLRTHFHLLDRIFTAHLGDLDRTVRADDACADLAPAARTLLDAARAAPSLRQLIDRSRIPRRDTVRLLAGLMRRGLLHAEPRE